MSIMEKDKNMEIKKMNTQESANGISFISLAELCSDEYQNKLMLDKKTRKDKALKSIEDRTATFDDLVVIEPILQWLLDDAIDYKKQSKNKKNVCANDRWYGNYRWSGLGIKTRLEELVGWDAKKQVLKNQYCYELAYEHIYKSLPKCRNCVCL